MRNGTGILTLAGIALAALVGYALWMIFASKLPVLPASLATEEELTTTTTEQAVASPSPDTALESQPGLSTSTELKSIEADLDNTVILDEDFADL